MKPTYAVLLGLLSACAAAPAAPARTAERLVAAVPCSRAEAVDVAAAGEGALQLAVDAAAAGSGCLELGPGAFRVPRRSTLGRAGLASLRISAPLVLRGAGEAQTTLEMVGDGGGRDWQLINVSGAHVVISDLTIDGSGRSNTNDQTHLIQVEGPAQDVAIERVTMILPEHGPASGGDCIRLLGSATSWVRGVQIRQVTGLDCDRSWLGIQRGVSGLLVEDSKTVKVGDQSIDFEPTGGIAFACEPVVHDVILRRLALARGEGATGQYTVAIQGDGCALTRGVQLVDSVIQDGSVFLHHVDRVTLRGVEIR